MNSLWFAVAVAMSASPQDDTLTILRTLEDRLCAISSIEFSYTGTVTMDDVDSYEVQGHYAASDHRALHSMTVVREDGAREELKLFYDGERYALYSPEDRLLYLTSTRQSDYMPPVPVPVLLPFFAYATDPYALLWDVVWPPVIPAEAISAWATQVESKSVDGASLISVVFQGSLDSDGATRMAKMTITFREDKNYLPVYVAIQDDTAAEVCEITVRDTIDMDTAVGAVTIPLDVSFTGFLTGNEAMSFSFAVDRATLKVNHVLPASLFAPPQQNLNTLYDVDTGNVIDLQSSRSVIPSVGWIYLLIGVGGTALALMVLSVRQLRKRSS